MKNTLAGCSASHLDRRQLLARASGLVVLAGLGRSARAWAAPKFATYPFSLGVAAGDPWPDGFVIWTRLAPKPFDEHGGMPPLALPVRWEVSEDEHFGRIVRTGEAIARPELGHSVHVELAGLKPQRPYWYRFLVEGAQASPVGVARTAPAPGAVPSRVRIGLAGCQSYPAGYYTAYCHLSTEPDLDAVFHYGDYIYQNGRETGFTVKDAAGAVFDRFHATEEVFSLDDYRRRYAQYKADPDLQAAHHAAAFIMSFDDHEVDNNWVSTYDQSGVPPEAFVLRRFAAMQAWYENVPVRRTQFPHPEGLRMYRRLEYGGLLRMHVLDTRTYRSDQLCESPAEAFCRVEDGSKATVLGEDQEKWLDEGLGNTARWNLIAQQVRVMPLVRKEKSGEDVPGPMDSWSGYPEARARLIQSIDAHKLTNVVIASGDSHMHNIGVLPRRRDELDGPAVATEFLGTSISSGGDGASQSKLATDHMRNNPHFALVNRQRGYQLFDITPKQWTTDVKVVDRIQSPGGRLSTLARFAVTPDKAALHKL